MHGEVIAAADHLRDVGHVFRPRVETLQIVIEPSQRNLRQRRDAGGGKPDPGNRLGVRAVQHQ
ncbi:MAG: hypothetical protein DMD81_07910, partial [Candidatus Rokuibacteriota bacterium]